MRLFTLLILGALSVPGGAWAAAKALPPASVPAEGQKLRELVRSGRHSDLRWPVFSDVRADLEKLYERAGWEPLWLEAARPTSAATELIARLAAVDSLGLDPRDYDAGWLQGAASDLAGEGGKPDPRAQSRFDVALSVAAARFVDALEHGRVSPGAAGAQFPAPAQVRTLDLVVDSLRDAGALGEILARHQPVLYHYRYLKAALARYQALARDSSLTKPPVLPPYLKPGMTIRDAAALRRRLQATGDIGGFDPPKALADTLYSPELVVGVKQFQVRHGQPPDGVIWPNTALELKRPFEENVKQIELALERWRWFSLPLNAPPIVINIPAFRLEAYGTLMDREDSTITMDVLVGGADGNATPVFAADMTYLVFRPYWDVPRSIMMDELVPRATWDLDLLQRSGLVLVRSDGSDTTSLPFTEENLKRVGKGLRMRQLPGPQNVLGLVKFMFPNKNDVYLHDSRLGGLNLFLFARRDFSHGCIRVSDPVALAVHVLRNQPDWGPEQVVQAMQGADNQRVDLPTPVPVYVTYATASAFENGDVYFYADIYALDVGLEMLLKKGYPYRGAAKAGAKSGG